MLSVLLAAVYTFTATATGLEKGAPVEFLFVGADSDRAYEALFVLDESIADFCSGLEKAGVPRGKAVDVSASRLWPVGCPVRITPALSAFVTSTMPASLPLSEIIYTGGSRDAKGEPTAHTNQPYSAFALYSLAQSPLVFNGIYEQGVVYNCHHVEAELKKGERRSFTLTWDGSTRPEHLQFTLSTNNLAQVFNTLRKASEKHELDVQLDLDDTLTIAQATEIAKAIAVLDSPQIKVNGHRDGGLFYRAFLPLVKWLDRSERLVQPFELTLGEPDKLIFIEEDWKVDGDDPKLTPRSIEFADAFRYDRTDTCFIFAKPQDTIAQVRKAIAKFKFAKIRNWYIFSSP